MYSLSERQHIGIPLRSNTHSFQSPCANVRSSGFLETVSDPPDVLDRQKCLDALAALRHAKWFQVCIFFTFQPYVCDNAIPCFLIKVRYCDSRKPLFEKLVIKKRKAYCENVMFQTVTSYVINKL